VRNLPFDKPGRFYRGNLHTHSTVSDGRLPPAEVVAAYRDHGYDFLALTEHFMERFGWPVLDTRPFRGDGFTTLIGAELHAPSIEAGEAWHILAVGLPLDFAPSLSGEDGPALARRARAAGAFVAIAHPYWYELSLADALALDAAHAVEVWNYGCHVEVDRGDSWYMSDLLAGRGRRLTACATDDAHFATEDYRGGWVMVRAASLEPSALLEALKAGHYYSSTGPTLEDVRVEGDLVVVRCSPARSIVVSGHGSKSERLNNLDRATEAALPLDRLRPGGRFRVTVIDEHGQRAWSNPVWLD
jgi:predicted metal-dependent phosphoesterase TrpH